MADFIVGDKSPGPADVDSTVVREGGSTPSYQLLVAGLTGQVDSVGNSVRDRSQYQYQLIRRSDGNYVVGTVTTTFTNATATVTVADNDFSNKALLYVGPYELESGIHYAVGAGVNDTATNLAAAINRLIGFSASALGAVITILGPVGLTGGKIRLKTKYYGVIVNFTLDPTTGFMLKGEPMTGPPIITT